jgi:hypothetical protein
MAISAGPPTERPVKKWWLAAIAAWVLAVVGLGIVAYIAIDPFGDESDPTVSQGLTGTACQRLAGLAGQLAEKDPAPADFIAVLGRDAAGIRRGSRAFADLLRGGHNRIPGGGFLVGYDDGTEGQVRHFTGIAVATLFGQGNATRWISEHLRKDPASSPDGQLTERGIDFATAVLSGKLALADTRDWILTRLCRKS